jgi:hypothetical protein
MNSGSWGVYQVYIKSAEALLMPLPDSNVSSYLPLQGLAGAQILCKIFSAALIYHPKAV